MNNNEWIYAIKKKISNSPLNRNYITDRALKKRIKEAAHYVNGSLLDVGCGEKPYKKFFNIAEEQYIGLDLASAHSYFSQNVQANVYGGCTKLPFKAASFDAVLCTEVLPHVEEPIEAFNEFYRVLKPNGILILTANKTWEKRIKSPIPDYWRFTDEGLTYLADKSQLKVVYTKAGCGFFSTIGQLICRFINKDIIYHKALYKGIDKKPNMIAAVVLLPVIAFIQVFFILLEKIYYSKLDTLFYILVAQKPEQLKE